MKKGQKMPWVEEKEYITRLNGYSEYQTGESMLPAGTRLFHGSYWKLSGFVACRTCFTPEEYAYENGLGISGYVYMAVLKKPVHAVWYDDDEVRIEINPENVDIYYLGNFQEGRYLYLPTQNANVTKPVRRRRFVFAKEFADIAKKLNKSAVQFEKELADFFKKNPEGKYDDYSEYIPAPTGMKTPDEYRQWTKENGTIRY